jgi:hypothetical protein
MAAWNGCSETAWSGLPWKANPSTFSSSKGSHKSGIVGASMALVGNHKSGIVGTSVAAVGGRCLSRGKCATKFRYGLNVQPQCQRNNQIQLERSSHNPLVNSLQSVFNVHQPTFTKGLAGIDLNRVDDRHRTSTVRCGAVQQQGTQQGRH